MLIATVKDEFWFEKQLGEETSSSKFEEVIREAGVIGRDIHCRLHEGHLFIHGKVSNYCQKQMAQEAVRVLPGVIEISNHLQVASLGQQTAVS